MKANFLKRLSVGISLVLTLGVPIAQAGDFDISVGVVGEVLPGVYGRVNITNERYPVVYAQPMIIQRGDPDCEPVYMHVPPRHAHNWRNYCHRYGACATPVYFVRSPEYRRVRHGYVEQPRYVVQQPRYVYQEPRVSYDGGGWHGGGRHHEYRQGYRDGSRDERREQRWDRHHGRGHHGRAEWEGARHHRGGQWGY